MHRLATAYKRVSPDVLLQCVAGCLRWDADVGRGKILDRNEEARGSSFPLRLGTDDGKMWIGG